MIDTEELIDTLIDDNEEKLADLLSNLPDCKFQITSDRYKYPSFLESSEGAPIISISAYFGSEKCYQYLADTSEEIPAFHYHLFTYACAGGNMKIIRDVFSRFLDSLDFGSGSYSSAYIYPGYHAIHNGHFDVVKWIFLKGYKFSINEICEACYMDYDDILMFFMDNINEIKESEFYYYRMLASACHGGNEKILRILMNKYPFKKFTKTKYQNLINSSCQNGSLSCVKYLFSLLKRFFPRCYDTFIQPTLLFASQFEYLDIIRYLINMGGKIDVIRAVESPLLIALTSDSYDTSQYYLDQLPQIQDEQYDLFYDLIFKKNYSISIIELLLDYSGKTLFEMKEKLSNFAIRYNVHEFFNELTKSSISLDFIRVELFDSCPENFELFMKLYELGAPFKFDISNRVFLKALRDGNMTFLSFAFEKGAVLTDEIVKVSECLNFYSQFYRREYLVNLLFKYNIDISKYDGFLLRLMGSCGNKTFTYEQLALKAVDNGAVITEEIFKEIIRMKWSHLFQKVIDKVYYQVEVSDIQLRQCPTNKYSYINILRKIFDRQPGIVSELKIKINLSNIQSNIADFIKNYGIDNNSSNNNSSTFASRLFNDPEINLENDFELNDSSFDDDDYPFFGFI